MTTAAELSAKTACDDLRKQLDAERICNRNHLARIGRLNALLVTYERERDEHEKTVERLTAQLAELNVLYADRDRDLAFEHGLRVKLEKRLEAAHAGVLDLPY